MKSVFICVICGLSYVVRHHNFPQRPLAVLDSTGNGEDAFTPARWYAGSVDHLHALFPGAAVGRVFVRNVYNSVDGSSQASSSAQFDPAYFMSLLAAKFYWKSRFTIRRK